MMKIAGFTGFSVTIALSILWILPRKSVNRAMKHVQLRLYSRQNHLTNSRELLTCTSGQLNTCRHVQIVKCHDSRHLRYNESGVAAHDGRVVPKWPGGHRNSTFNKDLKQVLFVYAFDTTEFANAYNHKQISRLDRKYAADNTTHALERAIMRKLQRAGFVLCIVLLANIILLTSIFIMRYAKIASVT